MSATQIDQLFLSVPRDEHGYPMYTGSHGKLLSARQLHDYRCFLLGIRDPAIVENLWVEEVAKRKANEPKKGVRRG